jgi:hypothetical protein
LGLVDLIKSVDDEFKKHSELNQKLNLTIYSDTSFAARWFDEFHKLKTKSNIEFTLITAADADQYATSFAFTELLLQKKGKDYDVHNIRSLFEEKINEEIAENQTVRAFTKYLGPSQPSAEQNLLQKDRN